MKTFFVLCCVLALAYTKSLPELAGPQPQEDGGDPPPDPPPEEGDPPPEGGGGDPPPEGGDPPPEDPPPEGGDPPPEDTPPGDGDATTDPPADEDNAAAGDADVPAEDEATTAAQKMNDVVLVCPTESPLLEATLTIPDNEEPPPNVVTNKDGGPVTDMMTTEYHLPRKTVRIFSEKWRMYGYALNPATKPNCLCQTRGPLSRFKLIGNLHFKSLKIPSNRRSYTRTATSSMTDCPPCNCADCFTTDSSVHKRDKVC